MDEKVQNEDIKLKTDYQEEEFLIVRLLKSVNCTILEEGYKKIEKEYIFCKCDPFQKDPICEECFKVCHVGEFHGETKRSLLKEFCHCGEKNHKIDNRRKNEDKLYNPKCFFHEWSTETKLNVYYETQNEKKICMYCMNFCKYDKKTLKKQIATKKVEPCECNSHVNLKDIFDNINLLARNLKNFELENLTLTQITNLMFSCNKTFENIYKPYELYLTKFRKDVMLEKFHFDPEICYSVFWSTNSNLNSLVKNIKRFYYFSESLKSCFTYDYVFRCLEVKSENNDSFWHLKKNILKNFRKIKFLGDFSYGPFLKICDIQNLHPLQRLILSSNIRDNQKIISQYVNNLDFNFLNKILEEIEKIINLKEKINKHHFYILKSLYTLCEVYGKFNLFSPDQIIKFCEINELLFQKFSRILKEESESSLKLIILESELYILVPIIKCMLFLIYNNNDQQVEMHLNGERETENLKFFHWNSDPALYLIRNVLNISNFIRIHYDIIMKANKDESKNNLKKMKNTKKLEKILNLSVHLNSLSTYHTDNYLPGLRLLIDKNTELYINYLRRKFNNSEEEKFVTFIKEETYKLENIYQDFFESKINENELINEILKSIKNVFSSIGTDFKIPTNIYGKEILKDHKIKLDKESRTKILGKKTLVFPKLGQSRDGIPYQTLINMSFYVFSLVKSIHILNLVKNSFYKAEYNKENDNVDHELVNEILRFLFYFVEDHSDNFLILITSDIINAFASVNVIQLEKCIDLIYYCLSIIKAKSIELSSLKNLTHFIKSIFKDLENKPKFDKVLFKAMKLLKIFSEIKVSNKNEFFDLQRKLLKIIFKGNSILSNFKNLLSNEETLDNGEPFSFIIVNYEIDEDMLETSNKEKIKSVSTKKKNAESIITKEKSSIRNKSYKDYDLSLIIKVYCNFLSLVNNAFDGNSDLNESEFLISVLTSEEIFKILENKKDIHILLRIELLKFYRMAYIDLILDENKIKEYYSTYINSSNSDGEGIYIDNIDYYKFLNNLIKIKTGSDKILNEYSLLKYELLNFRDIITDQSSNDIIEYLENGIIMPLYVFFNKFMNLIFNHSGKNFIIFYEIALYFLNFKKYLIENRDDFKGKTIKKEKGLFHNGFQSDNSKIILINEDFLKADISELENDINEMTNDYFEIINYKVVHNLFDKHFKGFLIKAKEKSIKDYFSKKSEFYSSEKIIKLEEKFEKLGLLSNIYQKKVLDILMFYENKKFNFLESSFMKTFEEINVISDTKNRNLYALFLLFLQNHHKLSHKYKKFNLSSILKILQYDTRSVQDEFLNIYLDNFETLGLNKLVDEFIINMNTFILSSSNPGNSSLNDNYIISVNILKILKYFCEEHNNDFQKIFFKELTFECGTNKVTLFNLLLKIFDKIILLSKWDKVDFNVEDSSISYYYDIFFAITELLIEMVQGTEEENLKNIEEESITFKSFLLVTKEIVLKDQNNSIILYNVRNDIVNFLMAFLEEKATPPNLINLIGRFLIPNEISKSIVNTMKKLYLKMTKNDIKTFNEIKFDNKICGFFKDKFFNDEYFCENKEFILANRMYQYLRLMADQFDSEEARSIIKLDKENKYYFMSLFFDLITKTVYICKEGEHIRVLFTINRLTAYLSENTKIDFIENVDRENRYTQLFGLINNSEYFYDEIMYNSKNLNLLQNLLNRFKYLYYEMFNFFLVFITNFVLLYQMERDHVDENIHVSQVPRILEIVLAFLNFLVIISWFYSKFPLYCIIELKKYALNLKIESNKISYINKMYAYFWYGFLLKNEVTNIFINMILAIIGSCSEDLYFFFCLQLFTVINLSITLKNIVSTITIRWNQIIVVILFIVISVYIFAFAGFQFINSHEEWAIELEDESKTPPSHFEENQCETLLYCFLTNLDLGMRTDGGIAEYLPRYTFQIKSYRYERIFLFVESYFLVIIVILIAVLLGVIIDTFVELREFSDKQTNSKENKCFICDTSRDNLEKNSISYENHVNNEHLVWNYVFYIIGLKFEDPQELNAINSYAYELIEKKNISWIPPSKYEDEETSDNKE